MLAVLALVLPGQAFAEDCNGKIVSAINITARDPAAVTPALATRRCDSGESGRACRLRDSPDGAAREQLLA